MGKSPLLTKIFFNRFKPFEILILQINQKRLMRLEHLLVFLFWRIFLWPVSASYLIVNRITNQVILQSTNFVLWY
jgi:hypothetical protein